MNYIDKAREYNIKLAADFLEMASNLLYIKSCSLLPKEVAPEIDPKTDLEQKLLEYSKFKKAAEVLSRNSIYGKTYFREELFEELPLPKENYSYTPSTLMNAYNTVLRRMEEQQPVSSEVFREIVGTEIFSVAGRVIYLLRCLIKKRRIPLLSVFENSINRSQIVATFLAVLELIRSGRVDVPNETLDSENIDLLLVDNRKNRSTVT